MDRSNNPFSGFDWKHFEKSMNRHLPHALKHGNGSPEWVEQYVHEILQRSIPKFDQWTQDAPYTEIEENRDHLIVKISFPDPEQAKGIKLFTAANQIKIKGASQENIQLIRLPHTVIPTSCKAVYKDGFLHLQIRKQNKEEPFYEIHVNFN